MNTDNTIPEQDESPAEQVESLETEVEEARTDADPSGAEDLVESLQRQLADSEKRVLMAQADLENFRRRTRRDTEDQIRYAPQALMNELLDVSDNLQRAIESAESDPAGSGLLEGVKMVAQQILTALENHGCKKIDTLGQPFNPNIHQAVQMQASHEIPANSIIQELRAGYQLHDRLVRPAQVLVSTGPPNVAADLDAPVERGR